jgi:hypothetical protein
VLLAPVEEGIEDGEDGVLGDPAIMLWSVPEPVVTAKRLVLIRAEVDLVLADLDEPASPVAGLRKVRLLRSLPEDGWARRSAPPTRVNNSGG